jgi:acetyl esterase/lipase
MPIRRRLERAAVFGLLQMPGALLRQIVGPPPRSADGLVLDLQAQALLWLMRVSGESENRDSDLGRARRRLDWRGPLLAGRGEATVRIADRTVQGAAGPLRARVYATPGGDGRLAPGLVWFHGGGFVLGSIESHDGLCADLAAHIGAVVVSIDYRLAPEHRFPAGVQDAIAATRWVLDRSDDIGIDARAVAVGGDSAGGNLAAVVAQSLRGASRSLAFQLLVYPATDATCREPSHQMFREGFALTERDIAWFLEQYLPDPRLATDPRVSPLFADDLSGLPPALVVTAGFDPLRDEGRRYAERMRQSGVEVEQICSEGSLHGFLSTAGALREAARVLRLVGERVRSQLTRPA